MENNKPPYSFAAIAGLIFGLLFLTGVGALGIVLGGIGLWQTRTNLRRGRKMAYWGLRLGCLSVFINLIGCPVVFLSVPVEKPDSEFRQFLSAIATPGQINTGKVIVANSENHSKSEYLRWQEAFSREVGKGHLLWGAVKTCFADSGRIYFVYFEKAGIHLVAMYDNEPDPPTGSIVFFPFKNFPDINDLKYSDKYFEDADFREMVDQSVKEKGK